jgi:hypothetical protein
MRRAVLAAVVCCAAWGTPAGNPARAIADCRAAVEISTPLPGRVDTVLATTAAGPVVALIGQAGSPVRFLPHDTLEVVPGARQPGPVHAVSLPPYLAAPGLAATADGARVYVLVDAQLLTLAGGRLAARQNLALQAVGWPAAITTGPGADVYLLGQPSTAMEAQAYAFAPATGQKLRLRWRVPLGLTHAGAWLGLAGPTRLAVYLPDQHDAQGTMLLLDTHSGGLLGSYQVPVPPAAASIPMERLYLVGAGWVRALALQSGTPVASVAGNVPLAVSSTGLVAYLHAQQVVVARGDTLRPVLALPFPRGRVPTALAWLGTTLVAGTAQGLTRIRLGACL